MRMAVVSEMAAPIRIPDKVATSIWLSGRDGNRPTLYLPLQMAKQHHLESPCQILCINTPDGILIKRLE